MPGVKLRISVPTEKDVEDLRFGMDRGVDFVALSFVCSARDVERLKDEMRSYGGEDARAARHPEDRAAGGGGRTCARYWP